MKNSLISNIYRKFFARKVPGEDQAVYQQKIKNEKEFYNECVDIHDLPEIFHYWSYKYLFPKLQKFDLTDPEQFFRKYAESMCKAGKPGNKLKFVSIGSGNCDVEVGIAEHLVSQGFTNFQVECVDLNEVMLERGLGLAEEKGVADHIVPVQADFNAWQPHETFDLVIANQSLHHVLELEHLFDAIKSALKPNGLFLTSDMIGRNGHQRWPEALEAMEPFWREMPEKYRYNHQLQRYEEEYINHDCSTHGFEGIRAQDILPLLTQKFNFELFIPFTNIVAVFVDRGFGHNFDASDPTDQAFIDRVHDRDEAGMLNGEWKPTQMIAVMRNEPCETQLVHPKLTPEYCIRWPDS